MATIAASPNPLLGTVALTVTPAAGETVTGIQRRDVNGGRLVRLPAGQVPSTSGFSVVDAEASLTGSITYQVMLSTGRGPTTTVVLAGTGWFIVDPLLPTTAVPLELVLDYSAQRDASTIFHDVVGRPDPVPVIGPLRTRSGSMDLWASTFEVATTVEAMYAQKRTLLMRQGTYSGMDLYHLPVSVTISPDPATTNQRRWRVSIQYREVAAPTGPLLSAVGWTYADLLAGYSTYEEVLVSFTDYNAVYLNTPS